MTEQTLPVVPIVSPVDGKRGADRGWVSTRTVKGIIYSGEVLDSGESELVLPSPTNLDYGTLQGKYTPKGTTFFTAVVFEYECRE